MEGLQAADQELEEGLHKQLASLESPEDRLIDLAAKSTIPSTKLHGRLNEITLQKASIKERLTKTETHLRSGAGRVLAYVELLENPGELHESLAGTTRRDLLAAFFKRLIVHVEKDGVHIRPVRTDVNEAPHNWQATAVSKNEEPPAFPRKALRFRPTRGTTCPMV